jgi:hypothetical protein
MATGFDQVGVAHLFQQRDGEGHVQARHVGVLVGVVGYPLVAPQDTAHLGLVVSKQTAQVPRRLMEVQTECVLDGYRRHSGCLHT